MKKDRIVRQKKGKIDIRKIGAAVVATMLVVAMVIGLIPNNAAQVLAAETSNINGFSATMIVDPDTSEDDYIFNGTPAEDGKIWTDKSVTTGSIYGVTSGQDNFCVALSALAQTYTTVQTGLTAQQKKVAYDVAFVLDFSGSMTTSVGNTSRAKAMVDALNPAIETLMKNEDTRIAVVGYAGSNVDTGSATTLLSLDHYSTTAKNKENEELYFEYTSDHDIQTVNGVMDGNEQIIEQASKLVNGGTPTQRGIYRGMDILKNTAKPEDNVTRIPIMVLLTDGAAGSANSNYTTLTGGTFYQGSANNGYADAQVGAYTVLTANYAKNTLDTLYRERYDYTGILKSTDAVAKFYTIGFAITDNSWTHFMLDPSNTDASGNVVSDMKRSLENDSTYGNDYAYADKYYGGQSMTAEDLSEAFADIMEGLQINSRITTEVNNPIATETTGSATGSQVVFTDYLGYKMELKGQSQYLRYSNVNYRFDKQADGSYKYSGYTQDGDSAIGPVITQNNRTYTLADVIFKAEEVNEEYNGQKGYWKVTWSFPSALLPTYSRLNDYDSTDLEPIRMLYEVGLMAKVNIKEDSLKIDANGNLVTDLSQAKEYVFHTNLYVYDTNPDDEKVTPKAMTWSEYTPAKDNPYYYKTGYTTDDTIAGTTAEYVRLDMTATTTKMQEVKATANIRLENLTASLWNGRAQFNYNGTNYRVSLSGNRQEGAIWTGRIEIPVVGTTAEGKKATANVAITIEATYDDGLFSDSLNISDVKIDMAEKQDLPVSFNSGKTMATVTGLVISTWNEEQVVETEEVVSVYMEVKGNETDGYYVEDGDGNKITVTKENDGWKVILGEVTYYSHSYYRYATGTESYTEKQLDKGTMVRSAVGYLEVVQSNATNKYTIEGDYDKIFVYHTAEDEYSATGVTFSDGSNIVGEVGDGGTTIPPKGTFKVCVDGIKNGLQDVNGNDMVVHFDFIVEPQTLTDGSVKYTVLDCSYWEEETADGRTYAVEVVVADLPEMNEETGNYKYEVSYIIESTHKDDGAANLTKTYPHFFNSDFNNGQMQVRLGNNGLLAVEISTAYDKPITVEKEWYNRLGNQIENDSEALNGVSIVAGLHRTYQYTNSNGELVTNDVSNVAFDEVVLNQENNFTYTWEAGTLPKYLVDDSGAYILDKNDNKVEVTYKVIEEKGADGWTVSNIRETNETSDTVHSFVIENVPLTEFSPSVKKIWTDGAPEGYKVKIELLANGEPVVQEDRIDAEHPIIVKLIQQNPDDTAKLEVQFGGVIIGTNENVAANQTAVYNFTSDNDGQGYGGDAGSGSHADSVTVTVSIANKGNDSKLSIANLTVTYKVEADNQTVTLVPFREQVSSEENTTTATYIMEYHTEDQAVVILDGIADTGAASEILETDEWFSKLDKWNLPMLSKDDDGNYTAIEYSIRETVLVPDAEGEEVIGSETYAAYSPDTNGLIRIPQADGSTRVFKATTTHTTDYHFTVENDEALTNVTAKKVWVDNDNKYGTRPDSITFKLMADRIAVSGKAKTITSDDVDLWNGTSAVEWTNLPIYNTDGTEIVYTVEETMDWSTTTKTDEYKIAVTGEKNEFVVTNSLYAVPAVNPTSMAVEKVWIDDNNADNTRPENIYMVLYRRIDGEATEELVPGAEVITLNVNNSWKDDTTWVELAKYDDNGKRYIYSVKEFESLTARIQEGISGYTDVSPSTDKTETSYKFTNQLDNSTVSKTVTKVWKDVALDSSTRPSVTIVLSGKTTDGNTVDLSAYNPTQIITAPWTYTWENLPVYVDGMKVDYTVTETNVGDVTVANGKAGNYVVAVADDGDGNTFTVTNTLTGSTTVTVTKEWLNTPEGYDIPTVEFAVYNRYGGRVTDATLKVTKDDLTDSITLPKYNADGVVCYYTIEEQAIEATENYRINSVVTGGMTDEGTFVYQAKNTYVPLKTDIEGTKTWIGVTGNNIPDITLELSRKVGDGEAEVIENAQGEALQPTWTKNGQTWTYKYTNLPAYESNDETRPYVYSIKETTVGTDAVTNGKAGDYEVTIDGFNITNKLTGTAELKGTKEWKNVSSAANIPDTIKIQLFRKVGTGVAEAVKDSNDGSIILTVKKEDQANKTKWLYNFNSYNLPKYDENGSAYTYFVKELEVTAGNDKETAVYASETATTGTVGDYEITLSGMNITNTLKQGNNTTDFSFTKLWRKAVGTPLTTNLPESITVQLLQDGNALNPDKTVALTIANANVSDASKWHGIFEDLRTYKDNGISKYKYTVNETKIETVVVNSTTHQAGAYAVSINAEGNQITNQILDAKTDITIKKIWKGVSGNNIPSIKVQLLQDGETFREITIDPEANTANLVKDGSTWTYTFKDVPIYQPDGVLKYEYRVKEVEIGGVAVDPTTGKAGDYVSTIDASKPLEITNELTGTVDEIEGKKIWKDVAKVTERPASITVDLYRRISGGNAELVDSKVVNGTQENAEWAFTFNSDNNGYAKYDAGGNIYSYFVKENGEANGTIVISGNEYKVAYGTSGTLQTITNTLYDEYTPNDPTPNPIKVTKIWKDDNNSQSKRPTSVQITLVQIGDLETITLTADNKVGTDSNQWSATFTKAYPMYDTEGALIVYSVKENTVENYTLSKNEGNAKDGFVLTNVYTPGNMTITISKTWVDNSNALDTRPEKLTLNLFQNGNAYGTIELVASEGNTWTATKNVPIADADGKVYTYTVQEPTAVLTGDYVKTSEEGLEVTNTLRGKVEVRGTKTWKNISEENRPKTVTVELWKKAGTANEVLVGEITTDAQKQWKYDFGELDKYDENGALYTYIVKETKVDGIALAETDYQVSNGENYDLGNELKDIKITISGTKTWVDNNDQHKMRPTSIIVNLFRDGVKVDSVEVKAAEDGTWTYEFKELSKYDMSTGKVYTYSVEEEAVANYNSTVNGFDITNTLDETKIPKAPTPSTPDTRDGIVVAGYFGTAIMALFVAMVTFLRRRRVMK